MKYMIGQMIIPIVMSGGNSGPSDGLVVVAAFILCNIIFFSIYICRALWWLICIKNRKPDGYIYHKSFYKYVISDDDSALIELNTIGFCVVNGFALFAVGSWWIYHMLGGALPLF